jgi:hypothetical protein
VTDTDTDTTTGVDKVLVDHLARIQRNRERENKIIQYHIDAYVDGGVELPYQGDATWHNVSKYSYDEKGDYTLNVNETLTQLSLIAKYAKGVGCAVEKKYDTDDFELKVTLPKQHEDDPSVVVRYYAKRDAVCEKKVIGTKVIPASVTPERIEEIVEWDCKPVSLLGFDASAS